MELSSRARKLSKSSDNALNPSEDEQYIFGSDELPIQLSPIVLVPIACIIESGSPRLAGIDSKHVRLLADTGADLPPILVHRPSMKIIDGAHRLHAARLRGQTEIAVRYFHGDENEAFLISVSTNIKHGMPLSLEDRSAAAIRIFDSHPEWSDRRVASVAGLSAKRVAELRHLGPSDLPSATGRLGRDGRMRPVNLAVGRKRASEFIADNPDASLRQIARAAGISPSTAADVRDRIGRGEDPVPASRGKSSDPSFRSLPDRAKTGDQGPPEVDLRMLFDRLRKDPSLRYNDIGRLLLRMFDACHTVIRERELIIQRMPQHSHRSAAELSYGCASLLRTFADNLLQTKEPAAAAQPREKAR